jgi:transposase
MSYRTYTREFKLEALELLNNSGKGSAEIERELGITKGLLLKWRDRYQVRQNGGGKELEPSDLESANAELRRLRRELAIAEEEREILHLPWRTVPGKKAVNIFSRRGR